MADEEWTDVARLDPTEPGQNRSAEVPDVLRSWLAARHIRPDALTDDDVRIDLVYLGLDGVGCTVLIRVRTAALNDR